jgi:hypothetical protein
MYATRQKPNIVEVVHAAVRTAEHDHRLKLFGNDGLAGISAQAGRRQVEQHRQFQLGNARFNSVAKTDVDHDADSPPTDRPVRLDAQAGIFQILADKIDLDAHNIEDHVVVDMHIVPAPGRHRSTSEARPRTFLARSLRRPPGENGRLELLPSRAIVPLELSQRIQPTKHIRRAS